MTSGSTDIVDATAYARRASDSATDSARNAMKTLEVLVTDGTVAQFAMAAPVAASFPQQPLLLMAHDLVLASRAAARTASAAAHLGDLRCARAAGDAALLAADLLSFATTVASRPALRADPVKRERLAHAAALTAFHAADLLDLWPADGGHLSTPRPAPHAGVGLVHTLDATIARVEGMPMDEHGRVLVSAARSARDGALAAQRSLEGFRGDWSTSTAARRFVRLAVVTAGYAGCAALLPLLG